MNSAAPVGDTTGRPLDAPVYGGTGAGTLTYPFIPIGTTVLITDTASLWNVPTEGDWVALLALSNECTGKLNFSGFRITESERI